MADIARLAGVSVSTVSRALANSPLIPAETRDDVFRIAAEQGYVVNQGARNLRLQRTGVIAVVIPLAHEAGQPVSDPFFLEMVGHLADEISARGYDILLTRVPAPSPGWLGRLVQSGRADGVIVIGQSDQQSALNETGAVHLPLVVWGAQAPDQTYCSVGVDNLSGGEQATQHLLDIGRRRIAFLGASSLPELALRLKGYRQALAAQGLAPDPSLEVETHLLPHEVDTPLKALLRSHRGIDGLVCATDVIALAAIRTLKGLGLVAPADVAVVGFDDVAAAALATPSLTTIRQDLSQGAKTMVDRLFRRIRGEAAPSAVMDPQLIIRGSTVEGG
jgi:DNA-binding LacI/PurR family transcriptional regulator